MSVALKYMVILLSLDLYAFSQSPVVFENLQLGIAFESTDHWTRLHETDSGRLDLINTNSNLRISIWHEKSFSKNRNCLADYLEHKGIAPSGEPFQVKAAGKKAIAVPGICNEMHRPVKFLFVAIPVPDGCYIVRMKCPEECFREHKKQINELIESIHILDHGIMPAALGVKKVQV